MTNKVIDALGVTHGRLNYDEAFGERMAVCGYLEAETHGRVTRAPRNANVTCMACLAGEVEVGGCGHDTPQPVHVCPYWARVVKEPGKCRCCPTCTEACCRDGQVRHAADLSRSPRREGRKRT